MHQKSKEKTREEVLKLLKTTCPSLDAIKKNEDTVVVNDNDIRWFKAYFDKSYHGKAIKLFQNRIVIKVNLPQESGKSVYILVRALEEDGKYLQVNCLTDDVDLDNGWVEVLINKDEEEIAPQVYSLTTYAPDYTGYLYADENAMMLYYITTTVKYVLHYMQNNYNDRNVVERNVQNVQVPTRAKKGKKSKKSVKKTRIVYFPKKVVESASKNVDETTDDKSAKTTTGKCTYVTEKWESAGYQRAIKKKDGTTVYINVKGSTKHRNKKLLSDTTV